MATQRRCFAWTSCLCSVVLLIIVIIFYTVLQPSDADVSIETASLAHVASVDRNIVDVNLTANINLRNPGRRQGVYYKQVEASAYYKGTRLRGSGTMPPFYVGPKSNTVVNATFWRESCYDCTDPVKLDDFTGWFDVDLWICTFPDYAPMWRCELTLRLVANKTTETEFSSNPCYRPSLGKHNVSGC